MSHALKQTSAWWTLKMELGEKVNSVLFNLWWKVFVLEMEVDSEVST